jgi:RNA polymerase sigma factor (sigma-70 family)
LKQTKVCAAFVRAKTEESPKIQKFEMQKNELNSSPVAHHSSLVLSLFESEAEFQLLRQKLLRFFEIQGAGAFAADLTDETISRVGVKLSEGVRIEVAEPFFYFRGVAVNVLREHRRREQNLISLDAEDFAQAQLLAVNPKEIENAAASRELRERQFDCLEKTLNNLPQESRRLFLEYHADSPNALREITRAALAQRLNIDVTALRNRVARLRKKIEQMMIDCLEKQN